MNRANSVPTMCPDLEPNRLPHNPPLSPNQQLNQLNNLALLRLHQLTEEVNQIRSRSQNLTMTQNLSQLTLELSKNREIIKCALFEKLLNFSKCFWTFFISLEIFTFFEIFWIFDDFFNLFQFFGNFSCWGIILWKLGFC